MIGVGTIKVKLVRSKKVIKFQGDLNLQRQAQAVGERAFRMIRARITGPNVDADGVALPPLHVRPANKDSIYNLAFDDPRYQEFLTTLPKGLREYYSNPDRPRRPKKPAYSAYGRQKERAGRRNRRDGLLTGEMWNHGMVSLTNRRDKNIVVVTFSGRSGAKPARGSKPAVKGAYNRDKARLLQYKKRDDKGGVPYGTEPDFVLMALNAQELGELRDDILAAAVEQVFR